MHLKWKIALFWWLYANVCAQDKLEHIHDPRAYPFHDLPKTVNGSEYEVETLFTPDWRLEEAPPIAYYNDWYGELGRPYRLSPFDKQAYRWHNSPKLLWNQPHIDNVFLLGCYCCTVYKRLTPLGVCAVITTRHVLTTATSTELVLKDFDKQPTLENILGLWYDRASNVYNSSMYASVSRIHYHPMYVMPNNVNSSHPIPCIYDMAVWATTYPFLGSWFSLNKAYICQRAGAHTFDYSGPMLTDGRYVLVVGYQFMWFYKKVPMPWFKYAIKTSQYMKTCPKSEWGWFFCLYGTWARLGMDSGAMLHRPRNSRFEWKYDGLLGMNAFSMSLRAKSMTHYFTVLDNYSTMEFLYDAFMGKIPYRYLDGRFYDTQWKAPVPKPWFYIPWTYTYGAENMWVESRPKWN